jgi:hypothetical protein
VKWLLRILISMILLLALLAAAWFSFPWYVQSLLDRTLEGKPFRLEVAGVEMQGNSAIGFRSVKAIFTAPPDECNEEATTYTLSLVNGALSFKFSNRDQQKSGGVLPEIVDATFTLRADSLSIIPNPQQFTFGDRNALIKIDLEVSGSNGFALSIKPLSAAYSISDANVTREKLSLEGINYNVKLCDAGHWQQPIDTLRVTKLSSNGIPSPAGNFSALFGSKRDPRNPCTLTLSGCSVELFQWKASTERIDYNLKNKKSTFTLNLPKIPLNKLPGIYQGGKSLPFATGRISGSIPVEFQDSMIVVRNAMVIAEKESKIFFYTKEKKPLLSLDIGLSNRGEGLLKKFNTRINFTTKNEKPSGFALSGMSATLFGGKISSTPFSFDPSSGNSRFTLKLNNVKLLDRIRLQGDIKGSLNGGISGTIPLSITRKSFAIQNGTLQSTGGGSITVSPPSKKQSVSERLFAQEPQDVTYSFSEPGFLCNRSGDGSTTISFKLKSLQQKTASSDMVILSPSGRLSLWHDHLNPNMVSLSDFSMGIFDGTVAIKHIDYDMVKKEGETTLQLSHMPLQKLLDLQGTKKIYATGALNGNIPVKIKNDTLEIINGSLNAEEPGQIIYATTDEERAAANPGLRITYEALSNFLYTQMLSSINMAPNGKSAMTVQLKGANPGFQNGHPVELNLTIQQNLQDLMRSISVSSDVDQIISDKATKSKKP